MRRLALAALFLAACASRVMRSEAPQDRPPTIDELEAAMSDADCTRMAQLKDAICDAAKRLCELADEDKAKTDLAAKCQDAKARCERARSRVERSCLSGAVNAK